MASFRITNKRAVAASALVFFGCAGADDMASGDLAAGADDSAELGQLEAPIVRGQVENGRNNVMNLRIEYQSINDLGNTNVGYCSSVLFAPRVLLTAAHCINPVRETADGGSFVDQPSRILAYVGNNFDADLAALGPDPYSAVPAAPAFSRFMRADSWETHPSWDVDTLFPDLAVVYLDRQPRSSAKVVVDPLPVGRTRLGTANVGQLLTIVGYGASKALNAEITDVVGAGIKRRGTSPYVGAPIIKPLPADPHPGIQLANVRAGLMQLGGNAPNANGCAGDSGGPAIRNVGGQDYVFGIGSWVGNYCAGFSYFSRMDSFLPFVDASYKKGGQAPVKPRLECVAPRAGGYRAYFGYDNQNGVGVNVPYGKSNTFAQDTAGVRPADFAPGDHAFAFSVDFTAKQKGEWRLSPASCSATTVAVSSASPRCAADNRGFVCAQACEATVAAGCGQTMSECVASCNSLYNDIPGCDSYIDTYHRCVAQLAPSGFECYDGYPYPAACGPVLDSVFMECPALQ